MRTISGIAAAFVLAVVIAASAGTGTQNGGGGGFEWGASAPDRIPVAVAAVEVLK